MTKEKPDMGRRPHSGGFPLDANLVYEYVAGSATEAEKERVRGEMLRSPEFARHVEALVEDLETLDSLSDHGQRPIGAVPDMDALLAARDDSESSAGNTTKEEQSELLSSGTAGDGASESVPARRSAQSERESSNRIQNLVSKWLVLTWATAATSAAIVLLFSRDLPPPEGPDQLPVEMLLSSAQVLETTRGEPGIPTIKLGSNRTEIVLVVSLGARFPRAPGVIAELYDPSEVRIARLVLDSSELKNQNPMVLSHVNGFVSGRYRIVFTPPDGSEEQPFLFEIE